MEVKEVRENLTSRVRELLDQTGVKPKDKKIDDLLPHDLLDHAQDTDPFSVLDVARQFNFLIPECCSCGQVRPNGRWIEKPQYHSAYDNSTATYCPTCEQRTREEFIEKRRLSRNVQKIEGVVPPISMFDACLEAYKTA